MSLYVIGTVTTAYSTAPVSSSRAFLSGASRTDVHKREGYQESRPTCPKHGARRAGIIVLIGAASAATFEGRTIVECRPDTARKGHAGNRATQGHLADRHPFRTQIAVWDTCQGQNDHECRRNPAQFEAEIHCRIGICEIMSNDAKGKSRCVLAKPALRQNCFGNDRRCSTKFLDVGFHAPKFGHVRREKCYLGPLLKGNLPSPCHPDMRPFWCALRKGTGDVLKQAVEQGWCNPVKGTGRHLYLRTPPVQQNVLCHFDCSQDNPRDGNT